jgi:hypothetical protein
MSVRRAPRPPPAAAHRSGSRSGVLPLAMPLVEHARLRHRAKAWPRHPWINGVIGSLGRKLRHHAPFERAWSADKGHARRTKGHGRRIRGMLGGRRGMGVRGQGAWSADERAWSGTKGHARRTNGHYRGTRAPSGGGSRTGTREKAGTRGRPRRGEGPRRGEAPGMTPGGFSRSSVRRPYLMIFVTVPAPTVRPPSRMA